MALKDVLALDEVTVGADGHAVVAGDRRRGLLGTLQWRGDDGDDVVAGQCVGDRLSLGLAALGEVETRLAPVEDLLRVVHFAVAHHMHRGPGSHGHHGLAWAAARAAAGRASAIRSKASSSRAAETNQASKALGGA